MKKGITFTLAELIITIVIILIIYMMTVPTFKSMSKNNVKKILKQETVYDYNFTK